MTRRHLVVNRRIPERRVPWPHRVAVRPSVPHRGTVALVGAGGPADAGSLLAQLREGGFDVVLVDAGDAPAGRVGHTDLLRVPSMTTGAVVAAIEGFSRRVDGVICWEPRYQEVAAAAAVRLGLPSFGETAAIGSADPLSTQVLLAAAGMRTPRSILAVSPEEANRAAQLIGCPVLFVARTPGGNLSRRRVNDLAGIPAGFAGAQASTGDIGAVLVEEVPVGSPVTVECWVRSGAPIAVAVIRHFGDYDIVDAADPLFDDDAVASVIAAAVAAVGVLDGHCGVDLLLADDGRAVVTGLRAGPPEGLLSHVVELVTGVNLPASAAAISCGREPEQTRHHQRRSALVTPVDIRAPRLDDLDQDLAYAGWIERYEPGGRAVVTGRSPRECALRAAQLREAHLRAEHLYIPAEWPFLPPSVQRVQEVEHVVEPEDVPQAIESPAAQPELEAAPPPRPERPVMPPSMAKAVQ
ncbi:ATP-grasp domain-containing protein [Herbidospora sp. RD11066]